MKNIASRFAENVSWLVLCRVYTIVLNFVISLLTARFLGPSNYGLISFAASFTALFTSFSTLGINDIAVDELVRNKGKEGDILGTAIFMRVISSALSVITLVLLAYIFVEDKEAVAVIALYSLSLVFTAFDTVNLLYQARLMSKRSALISAAAYTFSAVFKVYLLATEKDVLYFAAAHTLECFITAVLLIFSLKVTKEGLKLRPKRSTGKRILGKSYHYIISGLCVALYGQTDKMLLAFFLDESAVGHYSAASTISSVWTFLLAALIISAKPIILEAFEQDGEKYKRALIKLYGVLIYVSFVFSAVILAFGRSFVLFLYGEAYLPAASALAVLPWSAAFSYLGVARSIYLVPNGKGRFEKYIAVAGALFGLSANLIFIPRFSVVGAAAAVLLTQIFTNFIVGFFIRGIRENNVMILKGFVFWRYAK